VRGRIARKVNSEQKKSERSEYDFRRRDDGFRHRKQDNTRVGEGSTQGVRARAGDGNPPVALQCPGTQAR
jgi:hypothetical protein